LLAIITFFYMILTRELVEEQRKTRESQTAPHISITIRPRDEWVNAIDMIIQNLGGSPALNLKFTITPDFEYSLGKFLSKLGFFKYGITYLDSKQIIRFPLTIITEKPEGKIKAQFKIIVKYEDISGTHKETLIPIDIQQFEGLTQLGTPPEHRIAREIENIQKDIHSLIYGKKMKVISFTKAEEDEEHREALEEIQKLQNEKI